MRFISKSSNLLVVLKPGLSAQPLTGTPSQPTVSVRFKEGVAEVPDGELSEMMLRHSGYEADFISADSVNNVDPYAYQRQDTEPQHVVTELKYGSPVSRHVEGGRQKLPPEMAKLVQDMATEMAKGMVQQMLPSAMEGFLKVMAEQKGAAAPAKPRGKPGRKPGQGGKKAPIVAPTTVSSFSQTTENPRTATEAV